MNNSIKVFSSFSSDFVSPLFPKKGENVELSIIFSTRPEWVAIKYDDDYGLLSHQSMNEAGLFNGEFRYTAVVPVSKDEFPFQYFFTFGYEGKSYYYAKNGIKRYTPKCSDRFVLIPSLKAPYWIASSTCYQIFPDRFCNGNPSVGAKAGEYTFDGGVVSTPDFTSSPKPYESARCLDFYNGDLEGIKSKIEYLKSFGIETLYLNPITASMTVHRFDSIDFFHIDPKLGGDEAFISLIDALHENGMKVIVDISINHTSSACKWLEDRKDFYISNDDGTFRCWQNVPTLVQLNYRSNELRDIVYKGTDSALKKFLLPPFCQDGWRLDVAPELGRSDDMQLCQEVWREVRSELKSIKPDVYLVGEDWDDSSRYMQGDMWDATMNYFGFGRPVRSWLGEKDRFLSAGWGHNPGNEDAWSAYDLSDAFRDGVNTNPDQMAFFQMNLFDSHDTPRLHNNLKVYDKDLYYGILIAQYLLPGMPSTYYGDEIGLKGEMGSVEGSRYPMEWDEAKWDSETLDVFQRLGKIRKLDWLGYSAFYTEAIDEDTLIIKRFSSKGSVIGLINKSKKEKIVAVSLFGLGKGSPKAVINGSRCWIENGKLFVALKEKCSEIVQL